MKIPLTIHVVSEISQKATAGGKCLVDNYAEQLLEHEQG